MPKRRYERREPTHEWSQIRPYLKDTAQIKYETKPYGARPRRERATQVLAIQPPLLVDGTQDS
jgi:hypothetical protein